MNQELIQKSNVVNKLQHKKNVNRGLLHRDYLPTRRSDRTLRLVQMALMIAISSVLVFFSFPILPTVPFLEYDLANIPILLTTFTMGAPSGVIVLTIAAFIQAFVFGHNGWIGFVMHMVASGAFVLIACGIRNAFKKSNLGMVMGLAGGSLAMVVVMIMLNFIFIPVLTMSVPIAESAGIFWNGLTHGSTTYSELANNGYSAVKGLLYVGIIPFNLIKAALNSIIFYLLYRSLPAIIKKKEN